MNDFWRKSAADPQFAVLQSVAVPNALFDEFPEGASEPPDESTRRHFLKIMGASTALASTTGCFSQPQEAIVSYVRAPEQIVPGRPLFYATAMSYAGSSLGLLVETHMARPTKVEGNPLHPAVPEVMAGANDRTNDNRIRFGATDSFAQACVLSLYDPDRSQTVLRRGQIDTWESVYSELRKQMESLAPNGGEGLRILTQTVISPSLADQIGQLLEKYPNARWHQYEPVNDDNAVAGARLAFNADVAIDYPKSPDLVLSLDGDCFADGPKSLQNAHRFRWVNLAVNASGMSRLYVVETSSTVTGAAADHRLAVGPGGVLAFAVAVARGIGLQLLEGMQIDASAIPLQWVEAVVADLNATRGRSVVIAGRNQPPVVHALAHWLNGELGNVGNTVIYRAPTVARPELLGDSIRNLFDAIQAKQVNALIVLGGNPAYDAPAGFKFSELLSEVPYSLHLSPYADETSQRCTWHVPEAHLFESWGDTRAANGVVSFVQPLITPLYAGRTAHELLAALLGNPNATSYEIVRNYWQGQIGSAENEDAFRRFWETSLHDGVIAGTEAKELSPALRNDFSEAIIEAMATGLPRGENLQLVFRHDSSVWDGRFANNAWLQELPRPLTKLTWDNAAQISPRTADKLRLKTGDTVEIETDSGRVEMPVYVLPGHPNATITVHLGYGRQRAGRVGNGVGFDVYPLRSVDAPWFAEIKSIRKTGRTHILAMTQHHHLMAGRDLVRSGSIGEFQVNPMHPAFMSVHAHHGESDLSFYPDWNYDGHKWGLVVNQSACFGCNACVVACQAENNIPVVGKDQVWRGREMHWLRIDSYFTEDAEEPTVFHQPVMCMHCEKAPCEPVCPVAATTHSNEGLNEMTYNRCIGTRYCSNNCPYKVRRFNFYDYNAELREEPVRQLRPNPDVTIRSRGVMEKCTYCVQRINVGRITADKENRSIRDGEVLTACQAACPTQALVFGDLNDPESAVYQLAHSGLNYSLLGDLNTRPRTTYLAALRNPNPALKDV